MDKLKPYPEVDEREQFALDFGRIAEANGCDILKIGRALYDAGYRKADDIAKETAEHILWALYDITFERRWDEVNGDGEQKETVSRADLMKIAKIYGVELAE